MNERRQDFELLQRFTREGVQSDFTDLVRRHLDLVFATAMRKVEDTGGAQEVAQNVFTALARKSWQFAPDDSVPAWLHKAALLESKTWLRGELGRRRREETASQLGTTMKTPEDVPAFQTLVPLLDEALLSLREKDRIALLLRYYEKQSLRDVGAAFGVSEDTAQKRVESALEKVTQFFKRRGYKTATVAATVAILKHTAIPTSATVLTAVVTSVWKNGPVALAGLAALFARLASMSRIQTAAVCVALAAAPVAWQLKERQAAGGELVRIRSELLASQGNAANARAEIELLQSGAAQLEQSLARRNEEAVRATASAQAFAAWIQNLRASLLAADYRWSDESAFVRIPKAILPAFSELIKLPAISPPGVVDPLARELLCLTPAEQQTLEETLQRVTELQRGKQADVYVLDESASGQSAATSKVFAATPWGESGPEAERRFTQMLADLRGFLGEERWPVLPSHVRSNNCEVLNRMLIPQPSAVISAWVETDENGTPQAKWTITGEIPAPDGVKPASESARATNAPGKNVYSMNTVGYVNNGAALSAFLPEGDPDQGKSSTNSSPIPLPSVVHQRMAAWFQEQATRRLGRKEKP